VRVFSLFDGISCGLLALKRAGIKVSSYFASEIDKHAIAISKMQHPDIQQVGDVTKLSGKDFPKIDILIGGSPCQSFSVAGDGSGFEGKSGLFFEYLRLLEEVCPKFFLLENVYMKKEWKDAISKELGVEPVLINSSHFSAQSRKRLYWTNIPVPQLPPPKKEVLQDILEFEDLNVYGQLKEIFHSDPVFSKDGLCHIANADLRGSESIKRVYHPAGKGPTLTTMRGGHREPKILYKDGWRKLTPLECERLQTLPDNYTLLGQYEGVAKKVANTNRYRAIGNGWTVDVIAHILKGLLSEKAAKKEEC